MKRRKLIIIPISSEQICAKILFFQGKKVMLDSDLAYLYGVPTHVLNQAVKRNKDRFPSDFMFRLIKEESDRLTSQIVISNGTVRGGRRTLPYVFTEQGVAMLSSVLKSKRAVQVNIEIMRAFTQIREMLLSNKVLQRKINDLEQKYDKKFSVIFDALRKLFSPPARPKREIGFHVR